MGRCRRHPHHAVTGICAHCLNDRLLALIEEEESEELMANGLFHMSPNSQFAYTQCTPSAHYVSRNGSIHSGLRRSPANFRHLSAPNSMSKYHHSLTSSPQLHVTKAPVQNAKSLQRIARPACDIAQAFISEEMARKGRSSLWSILRGLKDGNSRAIKKQSYTESHDGDQSHAWRGSSHDGRPKTRQFVGATSENVGRESRWKATNDGLVYPGKSHFRSNGREAHDSLCQGEYASSLLSSPQFMASPSRVHGKHHFPSPVSKFTATSPLHQERYGDEEKASPKTRHVVQTGYGFTLPNERYDHENESSRGSWISSFFSGRNRRSKSISGSDAMMFSQPSHVYSGGASPNLALQGRRKSLSLLNDEMKENTIAGPSIGSRPSHMNKSPKVGIKSADNKYKHDNHHGMRVFDISDRHSSKQLRSSNGSFHDAFGDHINHQERSSVEGGSLNTLAGYPSTSPNGSKLEAVLVKSPRAKLASFLNKRRNGTMSIDCRDVRVSPVPMLKVRRDNSSQQEFFDYQDDYKSNQGHLQSLEQLHGSTESYDDAFNVKQEALRRTSVVENMAVMDNDALKSPRLMSLQAMKQLLKSPKLAPVKTSKRPGFEDEEYGQQHAVPTRNSWSKAFSKTLSPMLGRKQKKKQSIKRQDFVYDGYVHTQQYGHSNCRHKHVPASKHAPTHPHVQQGHCNHEHPLAAENIGVRSFHMAGGLTKGMSCL
ncbi:hypothetical protein L7F22_021696 [Adiantum nelumboides]|nr:hypothetical protein [Adiantum nelumboides]